ncbi:hypothetical protein RSAG8_00540, partial [Rhizoctonia solani AG-8 WAC10335]
MRKLIDPQPTYTVPLDIPDTSEDQPVGQTIPRVGHGQWPSIIFGAATLGAGIYNTEEPTQRLDSYPCYSSQLDGVLDQADLLTLGSTPLLYSHWCLAIQHISSPSTNTN